MNQYKVECLGGHIFTPEHGSELEDRCLQQGEGILTIPVSECPKCAEAQDEKKAA